jgi:hypothetical protein
MHRGIFELLNRYSPCPTFSIIERSRCISTHIPGVIQIEIVVCNYLCRLELFMSSVCYITLEPELSN